MKRWFAIISCLLITTLAIHHAYAQHTSVRTHTISAISSGYLGVGVAEVDEDRMKTLKLKDEHGVVVMNVGEDTPAAKAGLKQSDVILEFNGQRVEGVDQFMRMVRETPANRKVNLQISRGGSQQNISAVLTRSPQMFSGNWEARVPDMPDMPNMPAIPPVSKFTMPEVPRPSFGWATKSVGVEVVDLNSQLAEYFGVKQGALVRWVSKNSPAEKAGIKAGDVVVKIAGEPVKSPHEVASLIRGNHESNPVLFGIVRNHKELSVSVKPSDGWQTFDDEDHERN